MLPSGIPHWNGLQSDLFFLIAGPCVVENEEMPLEIAEKIIPITKRLGIPYIFKASCTQKQQPLFIKTTRFSRSA